MTFRTVTKLAVSVLLIGLSVAMRGEGGGLKSPAVAGQLSEANPHCTMVGGSVMTDFGAVDQNTTMGTATGDFRGAVSATLLGAPQQVGNTLVFHVQHHWVTESGDMIFFDPATATTVAISQTLFAIVTYPVCQEHQRVKGDKCASI